MSNLLSICIGSKCAVCGIAVSNWNLSMVISVIYLFFLDLDLNMIFSPSCLCPRLMRNPKYRVLAPPIGQLVINIKSRHQHTHISPGRPTWPQSLLKEMSTIFQVHEFTLTLGLVSYKNAHVLLQEGSVWQSCSSMSL